MTDSNADMPSEMPIQVLIDHPANACQLRDLCRNEIARQADIVESLIAQLAEMKQWWESSIEERDALMTELTTLRQWHKDNAGVLAAHRIGGYSFDPLPESQP